MIFSSLIISFSDAELGHSPEPVGEHGEHGAGIHPHAHLGWPALDPASAMAASHLGYLPVDVHKLSEQSHQLLKHESNVKLEPVDPHAKENSSTVLAPVVSSSAPSVSSSASAVPTPEQYHNWMLQHHYSNPSMYQHYQAHQNIEVQHPAIGFA